MKIFRNLKLQYKMLILAIIPVLVMGIVAILISNTVVKITAGRCEAETESDIECRACGV